MMAAKVTGHLSNDASRLVVVSRTTITSYPAKTLSKVILFLSNCTGMSGYR